MRDVTLAEEASRICINSGVMARLRSQALNIARTNGATNIARAMWNAAFDPVINLSYSGLQQALNSPVADPAHGIALDHYDIRQYARPMQKLASFVTFICFVLPGICAGVARADVLADATTCLVKPKQVVQLGSSVFGVLAELKVDRSDMVTKGQVLGKLDTSVEEAQLALDNFRARNPAQVRAAKADLAWNQRELERRQKLAHNMWSKINDVDEVMTKVEQDKIAIDKAEDELKTAALEAARSQAQYNLRLIRSPLNGVVSEIKLQPGEFIYETTPIVTLAQIDPLTVDLVVPSKRFGAVKVGEIVELRLLPPVDKVVKAEIDVIDPIIDAASNTFRLRLALPNPENAIPAGVRCNANLPDSPP